MDLASMICAMVIVPVLSLSLSQIYELLVVDTQPNEAVSIIECDMKVQ